MQVIITSPRTQEEYDVEYAVLHTPTGMLTVYPQHEHTLTLLSDTPIELHAHGSVTPVPVYKGIAHILPTGITILHEGTIQPS